MLTTGVEWGGHVHFCQRLLPWLIQIIGGFLRRKTGAVGHIASDSPICKIRRMSRICSFHWASKLKGFQLHGGGFAPKRIGSVPGSRRGLHPQNPVRLALRINHVSIPHFLTWRRPRFRVSKSGAISQSSVQRCNCNGNRSKLDLRRLRVKELL